jgi:predicted permease
VVSAIMIAVLVPLTSVAVIVVLNKYGDIDISGIRRNIISILANPLIIASLLGVAVNMAEFELPIFADRIIFSLGNVSLALGLLCVGAGLDLKAIKGKRPVIISSILCKLCVFPVTVLGLCLLFGLSGTAAQVMILYMGLPAASSSFIMARKMGGDATLMAGILFVETVVAMVTMPVLIMLSARLFG